MKKILDEIYIFFKWKIYTPIVEFPREVKYFIQRGRRGYSDSDVWNFHNYLSKVIAGGLKDLSENAHGYPCSFDKGNDVEAYEAWKNLLMNLSKSFEDQANDMDFEIWHDDFTQFGSVYANKKADERKLKWKKDFELFVEHYESFWD